MPRCSRAVIRGTKAQRSVLAFTPSLTLAMRVRNKGFESFEVLTGNGLQESDYKYILQLQMGDPRPIPAVVHCPARVLPSIPMQDQLLDGRKSVAFFRIPGKRTALVAGTDKVKDFHVRV